MFLESRMRVEVLLFGAEAAAAGCDRVAVEACEGAGTHEVKEMLGAAYPALRPFLGAARLAVNCEFAGSETVVRAGDEVALIGMVSGG